MQQDGVDPSILDSVPDGEGKENESEVAQPSSAQTTVKDSEQYQKFFKLLKMGMPAEQVKLKMSAEGLNPDLLDTPDAPLEGDKSGSSAESSKTVKDDPQYAKFFKLLKMGMPHEQIKLKMQAEGLNPDYLDDPDAPLQSSSGSQTKVKDDPSYAKFFKLLKMGMPPEQVKMKMSAEGLNPDLLDNPDAPSPDSSSGNQSTGLPPPKEAVKVDPSKLNAALSNKKKRGSSQQQIQDPSLPKKEPVKPNVEMRSLFWSRIPVNVVKSTLWKDISEQNVEFDVKEMEWMFRKNEPKKINTEKKKKEKEAPQEVLLLDPKRQQNVAIAIARIKMPASELKEHILNLDEEKLGPEILNVLISTAPTLEEQDLLKNYEGDTEKLGNVEKFFLELLTIPRYTQRIKCMRFKMQFENRILELQSQIDTLATATEQIADSTNFRKILEAVLAMGNYMNGSTPRGAAYGFRLETLTKLHTVRSVDQRITLMTFLLRQLEEHCPEAIAFAGEVSEVSEAKRISLDQVRADINACNSEIGMLQGQVKASKTDNNPEDKFYEVMAPFAKDAVEVIEEVKKDFASVETSFSELVSAFGEDPRKFGPIELFTIIDDFVTEFKNAYRQNHTKEIETVWEKNLEALAEAEEKSKLEKYEKELQEKGVNYESVSGEEAKQLYDHVMETITSRAIELGDESLQSVEEFKTISLQYGSEEISADEFCSRVRKCFGTKTAKKIIPSSAKLLADSRKRIELLLAHEKMMEKAKQEKEEKRLRRQRESLTSSSHMFEDTSESTHDTEKSKPENAESTAKPPATPQRRKKVALKMLDHIQPLEGEEAQNLHRSILESVYTAFNKDNKKMKKFTHNARKFGKEEISARDYYQYLTESFDPDFVGRLVPDLAKLLKDADKRHALIEALCESAPGWAKFSGL